MAYVSFSNYNGGGSKNDQAIYKNYGQYGGQQPPTPVEPQNNPQQGIKPPQGIRPTNNTQPYYESDMSNTPNMPNNVPPPQYMNINNQNSQNGQNMQNAQNAPAEPTNGHVHRQHRVHNIESERMIELLTNHNYHYAPDGKPMKVVCKVYTDWCKPCRDISPFYENISAHPEFSNILFLELDAEKIDDNLARLVKVGAVPVFIGFVGGKQVEFIPGPDREKIVSLCKKLATL
jgi:thioredoxin 1